MRKYSTKRAPAGVDSDPLGDEPVDLGIPVEDEGDLGIPVEDEDDFDNDIDTYMSDHDQDDDLLMDDEDAENHRTAVFNAAQAPFSITLVIDSLHVGMASADEGPSTIVGRIAVEVSDFGTSAYGLDLLNDLRAAGGKVVFFDRSDVQGIAPRIEGTYMSDGWELEAWLTGDLFQKIRLFASHLFEVLEGNVFDPLLDSCLVVEAVVQHRMPRGDYDGVGLPGWVKSLKFGRVVRKF